MKKLSLGFCLCSIIFVNNTVCAFEIGNSVEASYLFNRYRAQDANHQSGGSFSLSTDWSWNQLHSMRTVLGISQDFKDSASEMEWDNGELHYAYRLISGDDYALTTKVRAMLPLNEQSRENESLRLGSAAGVDVRLVNMANTAMNSGYSFSFVKNVHEYTTHRVSGASNTSHAIRNQLTFDYSWQKFLLAIGAFHQMSWNYKGTRKSDQINLSQSLVYNQSAQLSLSLCHQRSGPLYRPDGDSNLKVYDSDNSIFYFTLGYSF